jgi:hypothetical protein
MERRVVELEKIISKLTDAIEQGQPVGSRLKERQQELDSLRWNLDEPEPLPTRKDFADMLKPLGPLVALGTGDPAGVRSVLRKIGVDRLTLVPDPDGGWWFKGPADFSALVHERAKAAPPDDPPPGPRYGFAQDRWRPQSRRSNSRGQLRVGR